MADEKVEETTPEAETKNDPKTKLSKDAQKVIDMVEKMTVLELSELVKAIEDKFGVSAAAPVAIAGTPVTGVEAEAVAEKAEYDVVVTGAGDKKIAVIKTVRELDQNLGLVEAKDLIETGEAVILTAAKKDAAEEAKKKLEEAGATVELR